MRQARRSQTKSETYTAAALRESPDDVFAAVEHGSIVLVRWKGRLFRLMRHSDRLHADVRRAADEPSPVRRRGWSWTWDPAKGGLRLARPSRERGRASSGR